jgi:hypothetical protein
MGVCVSKGVLGCSANAFEWLCCVLAITTLSLIAQGTDVVTYGKRRGVYAHWFCGQHSLQIGWHLSTEADPAPVMASKIQHQKQPQRFLILELQDAVS